MSDFQSKNNVIYARGFNAGLSAAIAIIRGGTHSATDKAELWGIQDDEQIYIAAMEKMKK